MLELSNSIHGIFLPKKFFVTSACATSSTSPLNAFDAALIKAKIAQCNLVCVSSILPPDAEFIEDHEITPGTITFCVMARMDGNPGETIGAGIGWAWGITSDGKKYGIIAEAHGYKDKEAIEKELRWKLQEMAKVRQMQLLSIETRHACFEVPKGKYGSAVVALVYLPWDDEEAKRRISEEETILQAELLKASLRENNNYLKVNSKTVER
ncbi:pyruvoyl-dependent arginine decarboxylase [Candidatus Bathyarchaeota archaeon]|nr:MAG: pyruvoyl-dependent arginine decarboxylase [Candidatus Bathyarchaeota archaeon]